MFEADVVRGLMIALTLLHHYRCESVMRTQENNADTQSSDLSYMDEVGHCLKDGGGVSSCMAAGAFVLLESASQKSRVSITDGLELYQNEVDAKEPRTHLPIEVGSQTGFLGEWFLRSKIVINIIMEQVSCFRNQPMGFKPSNFKANETLRQVVPMFKKSHQQHYYGAVGGETTDFHTLLEASTKFLQRRNLRWSLESLYPGLELCVGATNTPNSGPPSLHFLLDPRHVIDERRLSTSRLLIKRAVLPYILGLKINLVAIMPLVFAALIFLTKKAFLLSKFAFLFTAMTGLSSFSHLTQHHLPTPTSGYGFNNYGGHDNYYLRDYNESPYNRVGNTGKKVVWEDREKKTV